MKTVVIWSSPNTDGLTAEAKNRFIDGFRKQGGEVDEIHLNRKRLNPCRACGDGWGTCRSQGKCVIPDDFADIYERMVSADGIVLVTAVYWGDLTEQMKLLMDRMRRCDAVHNHFLNGKRCVLVACAGGTGQGTVECLGHMETTIKHMGMRAYDRIPVVRYNKDYMLPALNAAGETYAQRLETGFDMYF